MALEFDTYLRSYIKGDEDDDEDDTQLLKLNTNCNYYEIEDMKQFITPNMGHKYTAIHMNVWSLPSKYDQIRSMMAKLKEIGITVHFIMLCETFLSDINCKLYPLPGYQFICNNRTCGKGGGVVMYICDEFKLTTCENLTINHNFEFETIYIR